MTHEFETQASISLKSLKANQRHRFSYAPDRETCAEIAADLDLMDLRKARLEGTISPVGSDDWLLEARLGATVQQACVVTLAPVTTRIEEAVTRRFVHEMPDIPQDEEEVEMPEDDTLEPLGQEISLQAVLRESLSLALPPYPRAEGAELGEAVFAEDGTTPMRDEDAKPFAGLAALKGKLAGPDDEGDGNGG